MKKPRKERQSKTIDSKPKKSVWKKCYYIIFGRTIPQKMFRFYLLVILISAGLLYCPFSITGGNYDITLDNNVTHHYTFWDALFISCSAFSDTGLVPFPTGGNFTIVGQIIILLLIQFGGFGFMTILFLVWNMFRKWNNVDLNQIIMLQAERGNEKYGNTYQSVRISVVVVLLIELVFAFLMAFWLCWMPAYQQVPIYFDPTTGKQIIDLPQGASWSQYLILYADGPTHLRTNNNFAIALWAGLFNSVSAMNNAGFDLFSSASMAPFRNDWNVIFQLMTMIEFVIGGIGFPLIYDLIEKAKYHRKKIPYRLSLFTKICLWGYLIVSVVGLLFAFSSEYLEAAIGQHEALLVNLGNSFQYVGSVGDTTLKPFGDAVGFNKNWAIFYNVMTTRSSGFNTLDQNMWASGTKWTFLGLMFIGASPSSTAGGIRTTTLAIILGALYCKIAGKQNLVLFKRSISSQTVKDSFIVFVSAILLIALVTVIVYYSVLTNLSHENLAVQFYGHQYSIFDALFETTSAFGTVGFTTNITSYLGPTAMIALIIVMFVGQLGVSSTLLSWTKKHPKGNNVYYAAEAVKIG